MTPLQASAVERVIKTIYDVLGGFENENNPLGPDGKHADIWDEVVQ